MSDPSIDDLLAIQNRVGRDPYRRPSKSQVLSVDAGVGEGNYLLQIPLLSLPGRGLDLSLTLTYNSKLWRQLSSTAVGTFTVYDPGAGWPASGWSLGFGRLVEFPEGSVLQDPDGTSHPFAAGDKGFYTTDGTLIDYTAKWNDREGTGSGLVRYPDGTAVVYGAASYAPDYYAVLRQFPTRITDSNGNTIQITYVNNAGPEIQSITDTLGRTVDFIYGNVNIGVDTIRNRLIAIKAPGLNGTTRDVVRFHYRSDYFPGPGPYGVPLGATGFFDAIYFPGTSTGYWFGDTDSYVGSQGIIGKVSWRRAMTLTPGSGNNQQGTITPGEVTRERVYSYVPANPDGIANPTYTTMTETWAGMDTLEVTTTYTVDMPSSPRRIATVYPDGTQVIQLMYNHPGLYDDGMVYQVTTSDTGGNTLQTLRTTWHKGDYESAQTILTEVTDQLGQTRTTSYGYTSQAKTNQLTWVNEYDYGGQPLRSTRTDYLPDPGYTAQHIFNLPVRVVVYDQNNFVVSRTEYAYDGQALLDDPGVPGHQAASPYRGNVTAITRYADAYTPTQPVVETRRYDVAGNMVTRSGATYEQTTFSYDQVTGYAYPSKVTSGSADPKSPAIVTHSFTYDTGTGLPLTSIDANGRTTTYAYDNAALRIQQTTLPTGALVEYSYDDANLTTSVTTYQAPGDIAGQTKTRINGIGLVVAVIAAGPATWTGVATQYDALGRTSGQSQPYACGSDFVPAEPQLWTLLSHDPLGRVTGQRPPDGSSTTWYYDEPNQPGSALPAVPGATIRVQSPSVSWLGNDVSGPDMWYRFDVLGSLADVVEPNAYGSWPGGSVFGAGNVKTSYVYNALGLLVQINQGTEGRGARFQYDSLGRLTAQHLPEKAATLDSTGAYVGAEGQWSDVFTYDSRSNLTSRTDARGVKTTYEYAPGPSDLTDPLNRLYKVSYQNVGPAGAGITPSAAIDYSYEPAGDVRRLRTVTTSPVAAHQAVQEYRYNPDGLVVSSRLTWSRPAARPPLQVNYAYDPLGRLITETYPAEFGGAGHHGPRKVVAYGYNIMGQLENVKVSGADYASGLVYNPAGQATTIVVGPNGPQAPTEVYQYDPQTNLLTSQRVLRGGAPLLDLAYRYWPDRQLQALTDIKIQHRLTYTYDALSRLWKVVGEGPKNWNWSEEYTFDQYGNRTAVTATGHLNGAPAPPDGLPSLTYDTATNHITTDGISTDRFSYDLAGNLTRGRRVDGSWLRYQYDQAGRLVTVTTDGGQPVEYYGYGADGKRLITRQAGGSTYFVWSRGRLIAEYAQDAKQEGLLWSASRIYLGNRTLARVTPGKTEDAVFYQHPDRLGTRLVSNNADNTTWEQTTLPFGTLMPGTPRWINPVFTTYDASSIPGLYYAVNRFHDSQLRFTQPDPIGLAAVDRSHPQTLNLYTYANNDPINATDPAGLQADAGTGTDGGAKNVLGGSLLPQDQVNQKFIDDFPNWAKMGRDVLQGTQWADPMPWIFQDSTPPYVVVNSDGSLTYSTTQTVVYINGEVSTGVISATDYADGSSKVIITTPDGTLIDRVTNPDGSYTETVTSPDGSITTTQYDADGTEVPAPITFDDLTPLINNFLGPDGGIIHNAEYKD